MTIGGDFDQQERRTLKALADILDQFIELRSNIPLHQVVLMLRIAQDEGKSQKHYSDALGLPQSSVNRAILDLGKKMRGREEGLGLLEDRLAPHSLREHEMYVSVKGRAILRKAVRDLTG